MVVKGVMARKLGLSALNVGLLDILHINAINSKLHTKRRQQGYGKSGCFNADLRELWIGYSFPKCAF